MREEWNGFQDGEWAREINVRNFIQNNYKAYDGDDSFLVGPTEKTKRVLSRYEELIIEEGKKKVLDIDTKNMSGINNFKPGFRMGNALVVLDTIIVMLNLLFFKNIEIGLYSAIAICLNIFL